MTASVVLIVIMAVLYAAGVYAMMERSLTRVLIGFLLLGNATNLLLLIVMGAPGSAPFLGDGGEMSDPMPQALTLTAIVITFAVSAFLLALIYRSWHLGAADTVEDDEADIELRERTDAEDDVLEDTSVDHDDEETSDFYDTSTEAINVQPLHATQPIPVLTDTGSVMVQPHEGAEPTASAFATDVVDAIDHLEPPIEPGGDAK